MKKSLISFAWAPAILLSMSAFSAQAGQELGKSCADVGNGTFSGLLSQPLICANGTWQDPQTLPNAAIAYVQMTPEQKVADQRFSLTLIGVPLTTKNSRDKCSAEQSMTVVSINPDKTANVNASFSDSCQGWKTQVEQVVQLHKLTKIATDNKGNEYHIAVAPKQD